MAVLHNARKLNSAANRSRSQNIFNAVKEKEKAKMEEVKKQKLIEIANAQQRKAQRDKIRAIRFEKKRMQELQSRMATGETVKAADVSKNFLSYEDADQNERYRQFLMDMEMEEELKRQKQIRVEIEEQKKLRNFTHVTKLMAKSDRILEKYKEHINVNVEGEMYKGRPQEEFEEDIKMF